MKSARCVAALMMNTLRHGLAVTTTIVGDGSTIGVLISVESVALKNNSSVEVFLSSYTAVVLL